MAQTQKSNTAPAAQAAPGQASTAKFKVKQSLSIPRINFDSLPTGEPLYIRILDKMRLSDVPQLDQTMKPGECVTALMLEDGSRRMLGITAVLKSKLESTFPNHQYVGKDFAITPVGRKRGRNAARNPYHNFAIDEIEWNAAIPGQA